MKCPQPFCDRPSYSPPCGRAQAYIGTRGGSIPSQAPRSGIWPHTSATVARPAPVTLGSCAHNKLGHSPRYLALLHSVPVSSETFAAGHIPDGDWVSWCESEPRQEYRVGALLITKSCSTSAVSTDPHPTPHFLTKALSLCPMDVTFQFPEPLSLGMRALWSLSWEGGGKTH